MKLKFVSILLLSACFLMVSCGDRQSTSSVKGENRVSESHSVATNKKVMDQFVTFINTGDTIIGKEIISPDVIFYAPTSPEPMHGFQGYVDVLNMMRGAMPDVQWKPEEIIADGNKIVVRFTMTGTQTNPFMGMPATGKSIHVTAMNIYEFEDGKIIREHGLPDLFSMLMQLGAMPASAQH